MKSIIIQGPPISYIEFPSDHKDSKEVTRLVYKTISVAAASPIPLVAYWTSLVARIEEEFPSQEVIILVRTAPCLEMLDDGNGFKLRSRIATYPDMPATFWEEVFKPEGAATKWLGVT